MDAQRMVSLLGALERRSLLPGPALAHTLRIDERRLRREIDRLEGLELGMRVVRHRGPRGGYSLTRGEAMPPLVLSGEEALAVVVALRRMRREAHPWRLGRELPRSHALAANAQVAEPVLRAASVALSRIERLLPAPLLGRRGLAERSVAVVAAELATRDPDLRAARDAEAIGGGDGGD